MSLGSIFDIAGTGMNAQSLRLNTTASNLANAQSASSSVDEVYRSRQPVFAAMQKQAMSSLDATGFSKNELDANSGVQVLGIVESDAPLQRRYEPSHPKADDDGYVFYPNVNSAKQMVQRVLTLGQ